MHPCTLHAAPSAGLQSTGHLVPGWWARPQALSQQLHFLFPWDLPSLPGAALTPPGASPKLLGAEYFNQLNKILRVPGESNTFFLKYRNVILFTGKQFLGFSLHPKFYIYTKNYIFVVETSSKITLLSPGS